MTNDQFGELVTLYCEGVLDADSLEQLNRELANSPDRVREFNDLRLLIGALPESMRESESVPPAKTIRFPSLLRWAAAACLVIGLTMWLVRPQDAGLKATELAPGWMCESHGATFTVIAPGRIRLEQGELFVRSVPIAPEQGERMPLSIETGAGVATAKGTEFFIGSHSNNNRQEREDMNAMKATRVLVLSGIVTLTNQFGAVAGEADDLLVSTADSAPVKETVKANSDFAFDLYRQLAKENTGKNLFFSPYSVSSALAMTAEGARDETAEEMGKVLRFPDGAKRIGDDAQRIPWETALIHTGMSKLNRKLNSAEDDPARTAEIRAEIAGLREELESVKAKVTRLRAAEKWSELKVALKKEREIAKKLHAESSKIDQYEMRVANALWGEKTYPFDPAFEKTINSYYKAGGLFPVDFRNAAGKARLEINGWVQDQTNDRIKDLIPEGALRGDTRLVLANAIYFKGEWATPFEEANTKDGDFTLADGEKQQTAIMHAPNLQVARYGAFNADGSQFSTPMLIRHGQDSQDFYPKGDGFAIVELPYKGNDLSMVVIAPNDPTGLPAIEKRITQKALNAWIGQLQRRETQVHLPKFKMETGYTLGDSDEACTLQKMGMVRAFTEPGNPKAGAQFQGMTTSTDPMDQLYLSKVFHKAFLEVNEKGTEAAAAAAILSPLSEDVPFTPEFKADRPFVFLIRERSTGSVLFMGRMTQPNACADTTTDVSGDSLKARVQELMRIRSVGGVSLKDLGLEFVKPHRDKASDLVIGGPNSTKTITSLDSINQIPIKALERQMRPGAPGDAGSIAGFLGRSERLLEIMAADNRFVQKQGLAHQELARPLLLLGYYARKNRRGSEITLGGLTFTVRAKVYTTPQYSPFHDGTAEGTDVTIINKKTGYGLTYSLLVPLMIERYGFYEGKATSYRVDPRMIIDILRTEKSPEAGGHQRLPFQPIGDRELAQSLAASDPAAVTELMLRGSKATDAGIAGLSKFTNLRTLDLRDAGITDAGLKHVSGLKGLTELQLGRTNVSDEGMAALSRLTYLRILGLSETKVTDKGLNALRSLNSLVDLTLLRTRVTDKGLLMLSDLPSLRRVHTYGTLVTEEGKEEFKRRLQER